MADLFIFYACAYDLGIRYEITSSGTPYHGKYVHLKTAALIQLLAHLVKYLLAMKSKELEKITLDFLLKFWDN